MDRFGRGCFSGCLVFNNTNKFKLIILDTWLLLWQIEKQSIGDNLMGQANTQTVKKPTAIDLFCGCGGTTEGLKQANYQVLCAVDFAKHPLISFKANHPEVLVKNQDIRTIDCKHLLQELKMQPGQLDLLAGCPPCQGFSSMRTKNGKFKIEDDRNDLIAEFYRFANSLLPKVVMLENVPGLKDSIQFQEFLFNMKTLGYYGEWKILNAKDFGVPQRRRRLIYVAGYNKSLLVNEEKLDTITVRAALSGIAKAGESGDYVHDIPEKRTPRINKMISLVPKNGGSRSDLPDEYVLPCHKRNPQGFKDVYGRMAWDSPSPTITGGCASPSKGRFLHPEENRCITMREAAILQGFPPNYKFPRQLTKDKLSLMIGNALPAPFIAAHAKNILKQISEVDKVD